MTGESEWRLDAAAAARALLAPVKAVTENPLQRPNEVPR
jgi:hypothetical protein